MNKQKLLKKIIEATDEDIKAEDYLYDNIQLTLSMRRLMERMFFFMFTQMVITTVLLALILEKVSQ